MSSNSLLNWPVVFNDQKGGKIPDQQVNSSTENIIFKVFNDPVKISGGFMEPDKHGSGKPTSYAIFSKDS